MLRSRAARRGRVIALVLAVTGLLTATIAPPAQARTTAGAPTMSLDTRAGSTIKRAAVHVNAATQARLATTQSREQRVLPRLSVQSGAPTGSSHSLKPTTGILGSGRRAGTGTIAPQIANTTEHQVVQTFDGIEQADTCVCEPPDPWVAVSPSYVVQSTNGKVRISNRAGTQLVSMPAWAFFAVRVDRIDSDPRIIWDAVHGRWLGIVTTFTETYLDNALMLAISDTSDPTGGWTVYEVTTGPFLADYPGIASSSSKIVFSSDDFWDDPNDDPDLGFGVFAGPSLYVLDWSAVIASGSIFLGGYFEGPTRAHFRPAQMLSSGSTVPVIFEELAAGHVGYLDVTQTAAGISTLGPGDITAFDLTSGGPGLNPFVAPVAQPTQPGPNEISGAVDERPTDAVFRSGHLWFTATTDHFDGADHWTAARWTEILTSANNTLPTQGNDWITAVPEHWFVPGVGISGNGTAFMIATRTTPTDYPATWVGTFLPNGSNLLSNLQEFIELEGSSEAYDGGRWGDYLGVAADPSYTGAVWVEHELVAAGGGWRTRVARIVSDSTAPTTPGPITTSLVTGNTLTGTVAVRVAWGAATDSGSGVASYLLERADAGGPFVGVTTTGTSLVQPLLVGNPTVQYRVRAVDTVGNLGGIRTGGIFRPIAIQSNTPSTVYTTGWSTASSSSFSGGSTKYSSTAGKYATFTATNARSIAIVSTKAASRGSFKVYVDGVFKATVSTYSTTTRFRQLVYQFSWSAPGTHKFKIVVVGTSGHPRVDLDAFVVLK